MAAQENNLWGLCAFGKLEEVRAALQVGGDPNTRGGRDNKICLMWAIYRNQEEVVDMLVEQPTIKVNAKDNNESTALHLACQDNNVAILNKLLAFPGILVNKRDVTGCTPIMWAIILGKLYAVRVMAAVEKVDLDVRDDSGLSLENLALRCAKCDQC